MFSQGCISPVLFAAKARITLTTTAAAAAAACAMVSAAINEKTIIVFLLTWVTDSL
jgi:hypothetical protein